VTAQVQAPHRNTVVSADPCTDDRWRALVEGPEGSLFTSPPWLRSVARTYGLHPSCRMLVRDGDAYAGFAYTRVDDLRGRRVVGLPFSDWSDPIGCGRDTWRVLGDGVVDAGLPLRLRVRDATAPGADPRLEHRGHLAWHATEVASANVRSSSARRNVAKAHREGVRVEIHRGPEALVEYHHLHVRRRKFRYGMLAQPLAFFENLHQEFAPNDSILTFLVRWDRLVIGGGVFLIWGDALYYKFGASSGEHLGLRPNDAMFDAALNWAREHGLRRVDWGCSDLDQPGLLDFKRKWADEERRITLLGAGRLDTHESARSAETAAVLHELTRLLTDTSVSDDLTARAGSLLYRYFC
jgi:CelD/BcsL family acetyltransferase involved in cellulose biosynthesis